jgi:hypothetical protein
MGPPETLASLQKPAFKWMDESCPGTTEFSKAEFVAICWDCPIEDATVAGLARSEHGCPLLYA